MKNEHKTHEVIAISLIRNTIGQILLVYKAKGQDKGTWILPGGHSEPTKGELVNDAASRENIEETTLAGFAGYRLLFHLEDIKNGQPRIFFIYESFYPESTPEKITLPKKILKTEGLEQIRWFYPEQALNLKLSPIARSAIQRIIGQKSSLRRRSADRLHALLSDIERSVRDLQLVGQIRESIESLDRLIDQSPVQEATIKNDGDTQEEVKKEVVVLIEDEEEVRNMTQEALRDNFRVVAFDNPTDALGWLKQSSLSQTKAILVDNHFKNDLMTGVDFKEQTDTLYPMIKTIIFTGDLQLFLSLENDKLLKPARIKDIIQAIKGEKT